MRILAAVWFPAIFAALGCASAGSGDSAGEDHSAKNSWAQGDTGTFNIKQGSSTVAMMWHGIISSGSDVEYWAYTTSYSNTAARDFVGSTGTTCGDFRRTVCSWTGGQYLQATFSQSTLNCASPPSQITAPPGAISFLGSGSYFIQHVGGATFAWTYVTNNVEYWAMNQLIPNNSTSHQAAQVPAYTSFNNFVTSMCGMHAPPSNWFTAYYTTAANFCSMSSYC